MVKKLDSDEGLSPSLQSSFQQGLFRLGLDKKRRKEETWWLPPRQWRNRWRPFLCCHNWTNQPETIQGQTVVEIKMCPWLDFFISGEPDISYRIGPISVLRHFWIILYRIVNKNMFLGLYDFEHFTWLLWCTWKRQTWTSRGKELKVIGHMKVILVATLKKFSHFEFCTHWLQFSPYLWNVWLNSILY